MKCAWLVLAVGCGPIYPANGPQTVQQPTDPTYGQPGYGYGQPGSATPAPTSAPGAAPAGVPPAATEPMDSRLPVKGAPPASTAQAIVDAHNKRRAKHCAPPLTWSPQLADVAQRWANSLRDRGCKFEHSNGQYGENLAGGSTGSLDAEGVVAMWYDEIKDYNFKSGGFSMQTGHFTQVVWRSTSQVGCGAVTCNGMQLTVCEYDPPGNVEGEYRQNVFSGADCR